MKEKEFISVIKQILNSEYIGDDCAYLKDLGIVISQDSLVEDVHFKAEYITPFQLGYKSIMVNLSDIAASGAEPAYLTVSLSLPSNFNNEFIEDFYNGAKIACGNDVRIIGGDITSSDKIYISVCAIGKTCSRNISSRSNAKEGYKIIVSGEHGSGSAGLNVLLKGGKEPEKFIKAHLEPKAQLEFSRNVSTNLNVPYAMMDTSDGLMDALSQMAYESAVLFEVDFDKIPYDKDIKQFKNWRDMVLFGGEDYQLVAVVPQDFDFGTTIGQVKKGYGVDLIIDSDKIHYTKEDVENKIYNHFKKDKE